MASRARRGYTLVEMVLTMAVLVVLAGLSYPVLDNLLADSRLTAASDQVRARWAEARTRAVEERRAYRFAIKDHTGSYRIAPDSPEFWEDAGNKDPGDQPALVVEGALPGRVSFCSAEDAKHGTVQTSTVPGQGWRTAATFLPDGTASEDVEIAFSTAGARPVVLKLRAVTGAVTTASLPFASNHH